MKKFIKDYQPKDYEKNILKGVLILAPFFALLIVLHSPFLARTFLMIVGLGYGLIQLGIGISKNLSGFIYRKINESKGNEFRT